MSITIADNNGQATRFFTKGGIKPTHTTLTNADGTTSTVALSAITKAVTKARPDLIAPYGKGTVAITPWQQDLFDAAFKGAEKINQAVESNRAQLRRILLDQYGSVPPTYAQFRADRAALKILAEQRGLVDDQWVRKPYNAAITDLYGALPESDSPAAVAKRAEREAKAPAAPKVGAPKGETTERDPAVSETIEQFIAKHGIAKVLGAAAKILAERKDTKLDATTLQAVASKYAVNQALATAAQSKLAASSKYATAA